MQTAARATSSSARDRSSSSKGSGFSRAPEVGDAQHHAAGLQRDRDQRVDAVRRGPAPVRSGSWACQPGRRPGRRRAPAARCRSPRACGVDGHEVDQLADRVERGVLADAAGRPCGACSAPRPARLLAAQHGVGQVDGDEVGEPGHGHLAPAPRRCAPRPGWCRCRTPGVVEQLAAAPGPPRPGRTARAARWCPAGSRRCPAGRRGRSVGRWLTASSRSPARCTSSVADPAGGQQLGGAGVEARGR